MPLLLRVALGAADRRIVLGPAADMEERRGVVDVHVVELSERQVREECPGLAGVPALVEAAVVSVEIVVGISRVDPERMVVAVLRAFAQCAPGGTAVIRHLGGDIHRVEALGIERIGDQRGVVHRLRRVAAAPLPAEAAVGRAEDPSADRTAFAACCAAAATAAGFGLDRRIDESGLTGETASPIRPSCPVGMPVVTLRQVLPPSVERCMPLSGPPSISVQTCLRR